MAALATVQEGDFFQKKVIRLKSSYSRIDDYVMAATWMLQRSPEEGRRLGEPMANYRILSMGPPMNEMPEVWIIYSVNGRTVKLFDITIAGK